MFGESYIETNLRLNQYDKLMMEHCIKSWIGVLFLYISIHSIQLPHQYALSNI